MRNPRWLYAAWVVSALISFASLALVILYGISFNPVKSSLWIISFLIAVLHKIVIADPIRISLIALWRSYRTKQQPPDYGFRKAVQPPDQRKLQRIKMRLDFLISRFKRGKWKTCSIVQKEHTKESEKLLAHYNAVLYDLLMFSFYIIALLLIVLGSKDNMSYYSTRYVRDFFEANKDIGPTFSSILTERMLTNYINKTIIENLHTDNTNASKQVHWKSSPLGISRAKVLGVVRLRQHRIPVQECHHEPFVKGVNCFGYFRSSRRDMKDYGAKWQPATKFPYAAEYRRLMEPWSYQSASDSQTLAIFGDTELYPGGGYIATLGRNLNNSKSILNYLLGENWIDERTGVLFIELTLYSVDANLFNIVTIIAERTPFGSYSMSMRIKTAKLLFIFTNLHWSIWVAFGVFFIMILAFSCRIIMACVQKEERPKWGVWDYTDAVILLLSILTIITFLVKDAYVKGLLHLLEDTRRNMFVSFYYAGIYDDFFTWMAAILVCVATIRLWKILHFALVFRVLSKTLYRSAKGLLLSICVLVVFWIALSTTIHLVNGGNSFRFYTFAKTFTTLLAFSSQLSKELNTEELKYGGAYFGMLIYAIQAVVVNIFLLNLAVTVAMFQLTQLKNEMSTADKKKYSFWNFMRDEFDMLSQDTWRYVQNKYHNADPSLRLRGGGGRTSKSKTKPKSPDPAKTRISKLRYTGEKTGLVNEILNTQMDYLERYIDEKYGDVQEVEQATSEEFKEAVYEEEPPRRPSLDEEVQQDPNAGTSGSCKESRVSKNVRKMFLDEPPIRNV